MHLGQPDEVGELGEAGEVRASGTDPVEVAIRALRELVEEDHEVLTVLVGDGVSEDEEERAAGALRRAFPRLEVEVHRGDQPGYPYLLGLE